MRKMASVRKIKEVALIPDADQICKYRVDGWWVVDSINKYNVGDLVIYCEIDSFIPHELAPFLSKFSKLIEYNGVKGYVLKTAKLRKQISQGLLLPVPSHMYVYEGLDVSAAFNIQKYEIHKHEDSGIAGVFPSYIPKTDQERIQNIDVSLYGDLVFEVTEKLDGSSCTVFSFNGESGVCSRNWLLKKEGTFFNVAGKYIEKLSNIALQGELVGPSIQGNIYNLKHPEFFVYDIFDIENQCYFTPAQRIAFCKEHDIPHVPVIGYYELNGNELNFADGKSALHNTKREGLVYKHPIVSFKVISQKFLLK